MKIEKIKYSRVKGSTRYWEPSRKLRSLGFTPKKWIEGPEGREAARMETARAMKALDTGHARPTYGEGSLAHYWIAVFYPRQQRRMDAGKIKPRTLEDYRVAWLHINTRMGRKLVDKINLDDCEQFFDWLTQNHTPKVRHRCLTKLKEVMAHAVTDRLIPSNPAALVKNPAPKPRNAVFSHHEIQKLIDTASQRGMQSMSLIIRVMYETARAPVDARSLTLSDLAVDHDGPYINRPRAKTSVDGYQPISQELYDDIMRYVSDQGIQPLPETLIFRQHKPKRGSRIPTHWRDDSDFSKDFAIVRKAALGPEETRKAMDIRRTANLEARLGGATPEERASLLANSLDKSKTLDATYSPATLAEARSAIAARVKGRQVLKSAQGRNENASDGSRG